MIDQAETWMRLALELAAQASAGGEVPIGCVIVQNSTGQVIGQGFNRRETDHDATAHAEILAIRQAGQVLGHWRLLDCTLVVTLEPCPMCAGAIVNARIPRLIYGCDDPKAGAVRTLYELCHDPRLNHRLEVIPHVLAEPCAQALRDFFQAQRALGKNGR
jgi:tRNA(adenine34) deaminase